MTTPWQSPGTTGFPTKTYIGNVPKSAFIPKKVLRTRGGQVFRPLIRGAKPLSFSVSITGANVVSANAQAVDVMIPEFIASIQSITGQFATALSQSIVPVKSGDTKRSIHHVFITMPGQIIIDVGPKTFYAPFIEYGMGGHIDIGPRPFMTDTFFRVIPQWVLAFRELAAVIKRGGRGLGFTTDPYATDLNARLRAWRKWLYTKEKALGDFIPFGGPRIARTIRGGLIGSARVLGDVQSVMGRVVNLRLRRRLVGRVTGRLIGIGAHTVVGSRSYGVSVSPIGLRAYNRVAGRAITKFVDQNSIFRGFLGSG